MRKQGVLLKYLKMCSQKNKYILSIFDIFNNLENKFKVNITCIAKMNKNSSDEDGINCLIVGTELMNIYIIDTEAFTILATVRYINQTI